MLQTLKVVSDGEALFDGALAIKANAPFEEKVTLLEGTVSGIVCKACNAE